MKNPGFPVVAIAALALLGVACASGAVQPSYFPPIVELSIAEVASAPLADGRWQVTINGALANTSDENLAKLELRLVDAVTVSPGEVTTDSLSVGDLRQGEKRSVRWMLESYRPYQAGAGLGSVIYGTASDASGQRSAVWVNAKPANPR